MTDEILYSGPLAYVPHGRDVMGYRWFMQGREIRIEISDTAMQADLDSLSDRVREARMTRGESELTRMLDWDVPNDMISLSTDD